MSFRAKAKKHKEDLQKRHEEQIESKDEKGFSSFKDIFLKDNIPEDYEFWQPGIGEHLIDIIPFFSGANNPRAQEGKMAYVIDIWVHRDGDNYVCQSRNFGESDPICDFIKKNRLPKNDWKRVAPKRRTIYLVWVHDTPEEEEKGLQIWEVSHFLFENHVDVISKNPKGGAPVIFSDIDKGKSIAFEIKKAGKYTDSDGKEQDAQEWIGHRLVDRDEPIPDEILEQSFPLDDIIDMHPDMDEVSDSYENESKDVEQENEEPDDEQQEEENEEPDDEQREIEIHGKLEENEEPDDEQQEEASDKECPFGGVFGVECDQYENCDDCDIYDDCSNEFDRLEEAKKKKKETKKKPELKKKKPELKKKTIVRRGKK